MIAEEKMISVEFSHNPYLKETDVLFNGRVPKVNSAVEKHLDEQLSDWVGDVPRILHDEMSGYDFDLVFSGTLADFESLRKSFKAAGVADGEVRFSHKCALRDARSKKEDVRSLLEWLAAVENRRFSYGDMVLEHPELLEDSFPLIALHGSEFDGSGLLSVEEIGEVGDLESTDLTNTPILFHVTKGSWPDLKQEVRWLMKEKGVSPGQLFFVVHPPLSKGSTVRALEEAGVGGPRVVAGSADDIVGEYVNSYPLTEYVRNAVSTIGSYAMQIEEDLQEELEAMRRSGAEDRAKLLGLDEEIDRLKEVEESFARIGEIDQPRELIFAKLELTDVLGRWRSRKTKVTGDAEIASWADSHEAAVAEAFRGFVRLADAITEKARKEEDALLSSLYVQAGVDTCFRAEGSIAPQFDDAGLPDIKQAALELVTVSYEDQKNDFFRIFNPGDVGPDGKVRVASCHLDQWRDKAVKLVSPVAEGVIRSRRAYLSDYRARRVEAYAKHVEELIAVRRNAKEQLVARLSDDERALQEDLDWLGELNDRINEIKRG